MSVLQNKAKSIISPLILNPTIASVSKTEADIIMRWAVMTYMVFDTDEHSSRVFSDDELKKFSEDQRCPPGIKIYVALRFAPPNRGISHIPLSVTTEDKAFRRVYGGLFLYLLGNFTVIIFYNKFSDSSDVDLVLPPGFLNITSSSSWESSKYIRNYYGDPRQIIDAHYDEFQKAISAITIQFGMSVRTNPSPPFDPLSPK
ncbi:hypothetical protein [Sphingobium sp. B11D3D]|uniref:hypothetical protein n=1 Tax=Sphingobium sp. B11D3D TaxID=2940576 RepID=UPI0022243989|nr:hypothetical protein [Sphingobium sp. B11D3D]